MPMTTASRPIAIPGTSARSRIIRALHDRTDLCTREAGARANAGPDLASFRAALREEAAACDALAAALVHANVNALETFLYPNG